MIIRTICLVDNHNRMFKLNGHRLLKKLFANDSRRIRTKNVNSNGNKKKKKNEIENGNHVLNFNEALNDEDTNHKKFIINNKNNIDTSVDNEKLIIDESTSTMTMMMVAKMIDKQRNLEQLKSNFKRETGCEINLVDKGSTAITKNRSAAATTNKRKLIDDDGDDEADSSATSTFKKRFCYDNVDNEMFHTELDEQHLWLIASTYENLLEWKKVGQHLGLTQQEIQIVQAKYLAVDGPKECLYQSLLRWRLREPENCYFAYLSQVFTFKIGLSHEQMNSIATKFIEQHSRRSSNIVNQINNAKLKSLMLPKSSSSSISSDEMIRSLNEQQFSESQLWSASEILFQDWKEIARSCLGLKESEIFSIESKHFSVDGIRECCYQSLIQWTESHYGQSSTIGTLMSRLLDLNLNYYVKQMINNSSIIQKSKRSQNENSN